MPEGGEMACGVRRAQGQALASLDQPRELGQGIRLLWAPEGCFDASERKYKQKA